MSAYDYRPAVPHDVPRAFADLSASEQDAAVAEFTRVAGSAPSANEALLLGRSLKGDVFLVTRNPCIPIRELAPQYRRGTDFDPAVMDWPGIEFAIRHTATFEPLEQAIATVRDPNGPEAEMRRREELRSSYEKWNAAEQEKFAAQQRRGEELREEQKRAHAALKPEAWDALPRDARALYAVATKIDQGLGIADALRAVASELRTANGLPSLPGRWWGKR